MIRAAETLQLGMHGQHFEYSPTSCVTCSLQCHDIMNGN